MPYLLLWQPRVRVAAQDQDTIYLDLFGYGSETLEAAEATTVYFDLQASGSDIYLPMPQYAVPDGDVTVNGWQVAPLWPKISDSSGATYIFDTAV